MSDQDVETVNRRALLGVGASALTAIAGFVAGRASAPEPEQTNWREKEYTFWVDVNDWAQKLGDTEYEPSYWQCCGVYLSPGVGKAVRLRHPLDDGEWDYQLVKESAVSSVYQRLDDEKSRELTDEYGDARRADLP